ncbi:DUF7092 domain-containing protein [Marinobacterium aestuariivivens]|uniref:DUF7092 domain-containing protein n=1 Tax=Marinobacterium aestuariivivens TaxID=1698799 RepID=A0ABW1ZYQ8_9GAMM
MQIEGFIYDGDSSARQPGTLEVDDSGRILLPDGTRLDWRALHCSEAVGSAPVISPCQTGAASRPATTASSTC